MSKEDRLLTEEEMLSSLGYLSFSPFFLEELRKIAKAQAAKSYLEGRKSVIEWIQRNLFVIDMGLNGKRFQRIYDASKSYDLWQQLLKEIEK